MGHNSEQVKVVKEYHSRTAVLANELSNVQFQKEKQVVKRLSTHGKGHSQRGVFFINVEDRYYKSIQ